MSLAFPLQPPSAKSISDRADLTRDLIGYYKRSMDDKYFYEPTDYIINMESKKNIKKQIELLFASTTFSDSSKDFLEKCQAYIELSELSKEKDDVQGQKIAKEIVGNNPISYEDLSKLFVKIHAVNKKMNVSDMITYFITLKKVSDDYKYAQGYTSNRFTRQRPIIISTKDDDTFICSFNFISYENVRAMMRKFGDFSDEIDSLSSKSNRPKFVGWENGFRNISRQCNRFIRWNS